jgi:hypothetical protein
MLGKHIVILEIAHYFFSCDISYAKYINESNNGILTFKEGHWQAASLHRSIPDTSERGHDADERRRKALIEFSSQQ